MLFILHPANKLDYIMSASWSFNYSEFKGYVLSCYVKNISSRHNIKAVAGLLPIVFNSVTVAKELYNMSAITVSNGWMGEGACHLFCIPGIQNVKWETDSYKLSSELTMQALKRSTEQ